MDYEQIRLAINQMASNQEPISPEIAMQIQDLISRLMSLEGIVADKAMHETFLQQRMQKQEHEREAYRHVLEQIVQQLRKSDKEPGDFQAIETLAVEVLALPDQALQELRSNWENLIILASQAVSLDPNKPDWIYGTEFNDFLFSWLELKSFHESHRPSQIIGAKVISELIPFIRFLRRIIVDKEQDEEIRRYAAEQLESLEGVVESTAWAAAG